jgi:hypothetical protein
MSITFHDALLRHAEITPAAVDGSRSAAAANGGGDAAVLQEGIAASS